MDAKELLLRNTGKLKPFLHMYNMVAGRNRLRAGTNNTLDIGASYLKGVKLDIRGSNNTIIIGDLCILKNCTIRIIGNNNVLCICDRVSANQTEFYMEDDGNEIRVGYHTSIEGRTHLAALEGTKIQIGEECMFASEIHFRTGDSHSIVDLQGRRFNFSKDIIIGRHVWIGYRVICLKGTKVPDNCVVGAASLLNKEYTSSNSIIAGHPARVVRSDINWLRERIAENCISVAEPNFWMQEEQIAEQM